MIKLKLKAFWNSHYLASKQWNSILDLLVTEVNSAKQRTYTRKGCTVYAPPSANCSRLHQPCSSCKCKQGLTAVSFLYHRRCSLLTSCCPSAVPRPRPTPSRTNTTPPWGRSCQWDWGVEVARGYLEKTFTVFSSQYSNFKIICQSIF